MSSVLDTRRPLVLASSSPRRHELLALLGSTFAARGAAIDEARSPEPARAKAQAISALNSTVIAADTRIRIGNDELGKPADPNAAADMLGRLAGRTHEVVTDVAVRDAGGHAVHFAVRTRVRMRAFDRREAERYAATGEPLEAAGGYKVQAGGGTLVDFVDGCLANVVGFPLCHVYEALRWAGRAFPDRPEVVCQAHFDFACPVWQRSQAQGRSLRDGASYLTWRDRG